MKAVRLPDYLHQAVKTAAAKEGVSMMDFVEQILTSSPLVAREVSRIASKPRNDRGQ